VRLTIPVRHDDLAEMVGASRPRVTEHLQYLSEKRLISRQDRFIVVHPDGLYAYLEETTRDARSEELS